MPSSQVQLQDVHESCFLETSALSEIQVKDVLPPLNVIAVLNQEKVSFVLVGAYGLAGWMQQPRATNDVDVVVADKQLRKATRALTAAYPNLEIQDLEVVIRLCDRETGRIPIDIMKQRDIYREVFKHTKWVSSSGQDYRIPSLEMAIAMKFFAMISPNRQAMDKYQDAHDFISIVTANPDFDRDKLVSLARISYPAAGEDILEMVQKAQAGEMLQL